MTTVDSWPKTLPMLSAWSCNSTTETHLFPIWTNYHSFVSVLITFSFQKMINFLKFYTFWCPNPPSFDNEEKERHGQRQKSKWSGKENRFHLSFFFSNFFKTTAQSGTKFQKSAKNYTKTFLKLPATDWQLLIWI